MPPSRKFENLLLCKAELTGILEVVELAFGVFNIFRKVTDYRFQDCVLECFPNRCTILRSEVNLMRFPRAHTRSTFPKSFPTIPKALLQSDMSHASSPIQAPHLLNKQHH
jgi:hypothetical protein